MGVIRTLWIDDSYFDENFPLPSNIERRNMLSTIKISQSTSLTDLLGLCLYENIEQKIIDGTLDADETELVEMCKQVLVYYTAIELIEFVRSEKGLTTEEGGRDPLAQSASEKSIYWEIRIARFIKNTEALYLIATADGCESEDKFNEEQTGSSSGVYYPSGNLNESGDCEHGFYIYRN